MAATWNVVINRPREQRPKLVRGDIAWGMQRMLPSPNGSDGQIGRLLEGVPLTPPAEGVLAIAQLHRDRAEAENAFDEVKRH